MAKVAESWDPGAAATRPAAGSEEQQVHVVMFLGP